MRVPIGVNCPVCQFNQVVLVELTRGNPEPEQAQPPGVNISQDLEGLIQKMPGAQPSGAAFHRAEDIDPDEWRVTITQELKECRECKNDFVVSGLVMIIPQVFRLDGV